MWLTRVLGSVVFLSAIILSIPLAYDVGGRACGLAYSLALSTFYFFYSVLRICTPDNARVRGIFVQLIALTQWLILPSLLLWAIGRFGVDPEKTRSWTEWTFGVSSRPDTSVGEWVFGPGGLVENFVLGVWDKTLRWSTPVFQLCEGFCSLLVIQAAGQITRWVVNRTSRSDGWMIAFLVLSASTISSSIYFLWRIAQFPEIDNLDAILIGMTITSVTILGAWGIGSGRGNPVESSLLFAYIVLCIYQIFTDYQPSNPKEALADPTAAFPPLPPIIMDSYTTLLHALSMLPTMVHAAFNFVAAALATITPSVLISLAYRVAVLYASTRIIPAVRASGARALSEEASLEDADGAGQILALLSWFSPSILVAVYTSLLMQHFARTAAVPGAEATMGIRGEWAARMAVGGVGGNLWKWINVAGTMALYALELHLGKEDVDGGVTGHWKAD